MQYTVPHYYQKFVCTASECSDTCCAGWQIAIDEKTLKKYQNAKGAFGNRLHNSVDFKKASFRQYDGRCAFLNEENLCDIYSEADPAMLCRTCRLYPRHIEEYDGLREISLSLSCPEAAKIILGSSEKVHFITKEKEIDVPPVEEFDFLLFTKLMDARDVMFQILKEREVPLRVRMGIVLGYAHDLQSRIAKQQIFAMDEVNERYSAKDAKGKLEKKLIQYVEKGDKRFRLMKDMMEDLKKLEVLRKSWPLKLHSTEKILYGQGSKQYERWRTDFRKGETGDQGEAVFQDGEIRGEQLMVYFLFTYMAGAVYDDNVYAKVKLSVVSTLLIEEMLQSVYQENGGRISAEEVVKVACAYSREVEHSDDNLNLLEKIYTCNERYRLESLLTCIMA